VKPILFSTDMVRAILDGRKTQTRRVIKKLYRHAPNLILDGKPVGEAGNEKNPLGFMTGLGIERPRYNIGDILYVRETWMHEANQTHLVPKRQYYYKADYDKFGAAYREWECGYDAKWRPSIHMPKEAARIFLRVTGVRVERLHDILKNPSDCYKEGIDTNGLICEKRAFMSLWIDTCGNKRDYKSWLNNPWVWVYEFERINHRERRTHDKLVYA